MKEYVIKLSEEKSLKASDGTDTNELGVALQIYQDLKKMDSSATEDIFIQKMLAQILEKEFNRIEEIPVPDYYK